MRNKETNPDMFFLIWITLWILKCSLYQIFIFLFKYEYIYITFWNRWWWAVPMWFVSLNYRDKSAHSVWCFSCICLHTKAHLYRDDTPEFPPFSMFFMITQKVKKILGSLIYQKMWNFKLNKNIFYNFSWEFNSFRVIFKKL